jgi:flagellar biosynthesis/type III secretory pathway M-ring protein FliF/YscJ
MVVLIPQAMTSEDNNKAEMYLKGKYDYSVSGDKIMVPAEKAYAIRGELFAAQALPKDTTVAFAELVKANNPFKTSESNAREWNYATQETLTRMLRYFPYIEDGTVIISRGERAGIGRDAVPSSASVTVKVRNNDPLTGNQVISIVDMIRGAVSGLRREDVHVTDGQRAYPVPSGDTPMPSNLLEYKKAIEDDLTRKLYIMFSHIPTVKIAVNAVPDLSTKTTGETRYDPKVVKAAQRETTKATSTTDGSTNGGEPGGKPNIGMVADSAGGTGHKTSSTTDDETVENVVKVGETHVSTVAPPGTELKSLTASISIPRSYFLAAYRRINHDPKVDPDDKKLQEEVIDAEVKRWQISAKDAIGADHINVDWFDDTIIVAPVTPVAAGLGATSITGLMSQYAKQGALAMVALLALGMMLMMVRRAVPSTAGSDVDPGVFFGGNGNGKAGARKRKSDAGQMDVSDDVFGEANAGEAVLTGIELDDETLQSRKMVDEVSTMIKENPENAASLVKRWMTKSA